MKKCLVKRGAVTQACLMSKGGNGLREVGELASSRGEGYSLERRSNTGKREDWRYLAGQAGSRQAGRQEGEWTGMCSAWTVNIMKVRKIKQNCTIQHTIGIYRLTLHFCWTLTSLCPVAAAAVSSHTGLGIW